MNKNVFLEALSDHSDSASLIGFAKKKDIHWARKAWHVSTGLLGFSAYLLLDIPLFSIALFCLVVATGAFILDLTRFHFSKVNYYFCLITKPVLRGNEVNHFGGHGFYALGIGLSLLLFDKDIALLSILFLIIADPMSSLVGGVYGKEKILPNKSLEGSLACFLVCYTTAFFYLRFLGVESNLVLFCLGAGFLGALSELVSAFKVDDNLTIPVLSGFGLSLLNNVLHVL